MATQVLIAHTGQRLEVDTAQFSILDDLKTWVSRSTSIPPQHIVALTPQGRSVKFASLHAEKEIFVYDIRISQPASSKGASTLIYDAPLPKKYTATNAPNSIDDVQAISSWQQLYKDRRNWAMHLLEDCTRMNAGTLARYDEIDVIVKCLDAAVTNLEISIKQIEPKYNELKKWVTPALSEHDHLVKKWEHYLHLATNTPISASMVNFMTRRESTRAKPTLEDLIEFDTAKKAGKLAPTAHRRFSDKANDLDNTATRMYQGLEGLIGDFEKLMSRSALGHSADSSQLIEDIEAVVKQMDSDYRAALGYSGTQRDLALASKTASIHTEHMVPTLNKRALEMDEMLHYATNARNSIASESAKFMRAITDITSLHSSVKGQINVLNQSEDDMTTFDYLRLIHQLPYMYASFVVEAIRRREWVDKVKTDSSTLANEMALFQDEESKRRRKWQKMIGSMYGPGLDTNVVGLEVNLLGEDTPWPTVTKEELDEFTQTLQDQGIDQEILDDILKLVQELNNPTKQQSKRLKAFKNGSIHEAALGRSGLMIRGDDDLLRSLQGDKGKLENKLRTAESRVRRLEDLLHRQSQATRSGNLFQPQSPQPRERQNSVSSIKSSRFDDRRRSSDNGDHLLRRITQLENELRQEKQRSTHLQQEITTQATRHEDMKGQIDEVNSTKKDLLGNMEALEREFVGERKALEDEIKILKARLEDTEDDLEQFDESRQHEKATYVEKVEALESELDQINKNRQDEVLKAQGQVEFLRKETRIQREQQEVLEQQVQAAQEESRTTARKLSALEETTESQLQTLKNLHLQILPDQSIPVDLVDMADSLLARASALVTQLQNTERDAALFKTDLEQANNSVKELRAEITETKSKLSEEEMSAMHLRENLLEEKAKVAALEGELADGREQLGEVRAKLTDGETGSEVLQKRLREEETKVMTLTEEVASRQSQVGSLEEELHLFREKTDTLQAKITELTSQYELRDERTKDLTHRLYSHNDRMCRLLERVGFAVSRNDGEMAINKIPRAERSIVNLNDASDPAASIRRSGTLSRVLGDSPNLELLYWLNNSDMKVEAKNYETFMNTLGNFDMDLFSDTIYRRIKEVEHMARKWQRESRAYRDKTHVLQKDSHEKIAFKHFKEGDLALFLPTRNQQAGAWAAFNVGFPHYFLREQDAHRLRHREWLVARISRIQERVVDLSKSLQPSNETDSMNDEENDNPFQLSDGLRWYLIDAFEDKPGAPSTPGMGKSTVAANTVEATANIHTHTAVGKGKNRDSVTSIEGINKTLSKSLESRRSSSGSKKASLPFQLGGGTALLKNSALASETNSLRAVPTDTPAGTSPTQAGLAASNGVTPKAQADGQDRPRPAQPEGLGKSPPGETSTKSGSANLDEVRRVDSLLGP
ncbi:autophagy-related protein 11-domain-containing protein [Ilyonectria robusta]|uniref:autophagy-related protein 11-domain-containing protein n=1 Tax=Ilyonectria robusta TaxID=1079257 RepID=UPI001E8DB629|nr:autophagy-related protein 11-domain-containing protein [Ilyonectria robusta]KAH8737406.1 autophagy-related protein 11-domain-containing protein [Ilyonectria robusta]